MALKNFGRPGDRPLERFLRAFRVIGQTNPDVSEEPGAKRCPINDGTIAFNDAGAFQCLNVAQTGGRRQSDAVCKVDIADAPIGFQHLQYIVVYFVYFDHSLQN